MEIHNNDKIVLLGREDLLDTAQNLPLEDIVQADFKITTDFSQADVVMFIDQYNTNFLCGQR